MAISNLVTGGQSFERPNVSAFFGKSPANANDNVEQVSSDFLSKNIMKSIVGAFDSISKELTRIQDTSKNIIKSFETLIKNTRDLNRDVTKKFRDANDRINQSRMDFLRSIMTTPTASGTTSTGIGGMTGSVGAAGGAPGAPGTGTGTNQDSGGRSWTDTLLDVGSTLADALDFKKSKPAGAPGSPANAAKGGGKWSRFLTWLSKKSPVLFKSVGARIASAAAGLALPGPGWLWTAASVLGSIGTAWEIYQLYKEFSGQDMDDEAVAAKDPYSQGLFGEEGEVIPESVISANRSLTTTSQDGNVSQTSTEGIINERSVDGSTMKMNTFAEKGVVTGAMMGTQSKSEGDVRELKEFFGQRISGGFMKRDTYTVKYKGKDLDLRKTEYFQVRNAVEAGDFETAFKMLDKLALRKDREEFVAKGGKPSEYGKPQKVEGGPEAPPEAQPDDADLLNKRIAGLASKNGMNPATVKAQLEGGVPTSITSDGKTIDVYNDLTDDEKEKVNMARKMRADMQSKETTDKETANKITPSASGSGTGGSGTEGAGGPDQKQQQQAPAAPSAGTEGAGTPEKAPSGGGAGTGGGESAAGTPTAAPAAAPASTSAPTGGGESTGTPAATTTPSAPAATATAGSAEGMTGSPSGTGTPSAAAPAPSTPPAPPATPEAASGGGDPIIVNSSSTKNSKSSAGGEKNNVVGQNLPMTAQNDKIQEYLAKQTVHYQ